MRIKKKKKLKRVIEWKKETHTQKKSHIILIIYPKK